MNEVAPTATSSGPLPEKVNQLVSIAARNSNQLKQLIDDLLDMEKLVSGRMTIHLQWHSLSSVIQDCIDRMQTYAVDRHIAIRFENRHPEQRLQVDRQRLEQALANLLSNAIKFSPEHGEVVIETRLEDEQFRVQVTDQGPGVPDNFRSRIFQKFAQADSSDTRGRGGTGLGLAITREIMTQMGGGVGFESTEGRGASFWLEIPAR